MGWDDVLLIIGIGAAVSFGLGFVTNWAHKTYRKWKGKQ